MFKIKILNFKKNKGFSLIELVVVLTIFLIVTGVSIDIFVSVVGGQRKVLEEQELLNQTSYVVEYMSTALKTAQKDWDGSCIGVGNIYELTHCPNGTLSACNGIKFINQLDNNSCDEFFLDNSVDPLNPKLRENKNGVTLDLLSDKFTVKSSDFIVNGDKTLHVAAITDSVQPKITILLDIQTKTAGNPQEKIIQTTISKRDLSVDASPPPPTACLSGYWRLDEQTTQPGPTIADSSGNSLWGTPSGGYNPNDLPQPSTDVPFGFPSSARSLEIAPPSYGSVDLGNSSLLNPKTAVSVAFWIKTGSYNLFRLGNDSWSLLQVGGATFWLTRSSASNDTLVTNIGVDDGSWHQVTAVWQSGQDQKKIYIDGVQVSVGTHSTTLESATYNTAFSASAFISGIGGGALVDDVRIYKCALSSAEVLELQVPEGGVEEPGGGID